MKVEDDVFLLHLLQDQKTLTICVLAFFFSASPCFLLTTSSSFFSSQFSIVSKHNKTVQLILFLSDVSISDDYIKHVGTCAPTFLQVFVSFIYVDAPLLTFPLHRQIVAELALVAFGALALLKEGAQH